MIEGNLYLNAAINIAGVVLSVLGILQSFCFRKALDTKSLPLEGKVSCAESSMKS